MHNHLNNGGFIMASIRYYLLKNKGAFVARMQVIWNHTDSQGNESHGTFEPSGYHDVCAAGERTIDINDNTHIPDGAEVQLKVIVVLGKNRTASVKHEYHTDSGGIAVYEISGTTLINKLKETSCS
jgi:hypothetical protein